jgi:hypothetical protein
MRKAISGLLAIAALIQLVPAAGLFGDHAMSLLYGAAFQQVNQQIVMLHQATLNGLLAALLLYAAVRREAQPPALIAGIISLLSFIAAAVVFRNYNPPLDRLLLGAFTGLFCLLGAAALYLFQQRR